MSVYPSWHHSEQFGRSRMMLGWLNEGEMRGYFWSKAKPLILNYLPFHHHSITPWQYPVVCIIIPFIWGPFLSFNHIHANYAKYVFFWNWSGIHEWLKNEPEWGLNEWIRCGLYRRDNTWFIHSDRIPPHSDVIPLTKSQIQPIDVVQLLSSLNERIGCGLYIRDHTRFVHFETIPDHSDVIPW